MQVSLLLRQQQELMNSENRKGKMHGIENGFPRHTKTICITDTFYFRTERNTHTHTEGNRLGNKHLYPHHIQKIRKKIENQRI